MHHQPFRARAPARPCRFYEPPIPTSYTIPSLASCNTESSEEEAEVTMVYRVLGAERVEKVVEAEEDACLHIQTRAFCVLSRFHDLDILDWHHTTVPTLFGDELT